MAELPDTPDLLPAGPEVDDDGLVQEDLPPVDVLDADEPAPPGRSWLFDMGTERFVLHGGRPQETRGDGDAGAVDRQVPAYAAGGAGDPSGLVWAAGSLRLVWASGARAVGRRTCCGMCSRSRITRTSRRSWTRRCSAIRLRRWRTSSLTFLTEPPSQDVDLLTVRVQGGRVSALGFELDQFVPLRDESIDTIRARIDAGINAGLDPG
jgi:hypothetical protein